MKLIIIYFYFIIFKYDADISFILKNLTHNFIWSSSTINLLYKYLTKIQQTRISTFCDNPEKWEDRYARKADCTLIDSYLITKNFVWKKKVKSNNILIQEQLYKIQHHVINLFYNMWEVLP